MPVGGVTLLCTAIEEPSLAGDHGATMNICWGQNANCGELGLGEGKPRSATKPLRCEPLDGISIIDIARGAEYHVLPRTKPRRTLRRTAKMARSRSISGGLHGLWQGRRGGGEEDALLECEKCENPCICTVSSPS